MPPSRRAAEYSDGTRWHDSVVSLRDFFLLCGKAEELKERFARARQIQLFVDDGGSPWRQESTRSGFLRHGYVSKVLAMTLLQQKRRHQIAAESFLVLQHAAATAPAHLTGRDS